MLPLRHATNHASYKNSSHLPSESGPLLATSLPLDLDSTTGHSAARWSPAIHADCHCQITVCHNYDITIQYNILYHSHRQIAAKVTYKKYKSITNRQLLRRTVPWYSTVTSNYIGNVLEMENAIYTFAPIVILSVGCRLVAQ